MIDWAKPIEVLVGGVWVPAEDRGEVRGRGGAHLVTFQSEIRAEADSWDTFTAEFSSDIRNTPEPKKRGVVWVNCYESGGVGYPTLGHAECHRNQQTLARKRVEWTEGEFDE